jgi:hypothetical protein
MSVIWAVSEAEAQRRRWESAQPAIDTKTCSFRNSLARCAQQQIRKRRQHGLLEAKQHTNESKLPPAGRAAGAAGASSSNGVSYPRGKKIRIGAIFKRPYLSRSIELEAICRVCSVHGSLFQSLNGNGDNCSSIGPV